MSVALARPPPHPGAGIPRRACQRNSAATTAYERPRPVAPNRGLAVHRRPAVRQTSTRATAPVGDGLSHRRRMRSQPAPDRRQPPDTAENVLPSRNGVPMGNFTDARSQVVHRPSHDEIADGRSAGTSDQVGPRGLIDRNSEAITLLPSSADRLDRAWPWTPSPSRPTAEHDSGPPDPPQSQVLTSRQRFWRAFTGRPGSAGRAGPRRVSDTLARQNRQLGAIPQQRWAGE